MTKNHQLLPTIASDLFNWGSTGSGSASFPSLIGAYFHALFSAVSENALNTQRCRLNFKRKDEAIEGTEQSSEYEYM